MAANEHAFDEEPIPGAMPERWETAIEDAAQVIALGLDRAQDLADVINDFARQHPIAAKLMLAATGGVIVGSVIAGRARRAPTAAEQASALAAQARSSAESRISDLSDRLPSRRAMLDRLPHIDREAVAERLPRVDREALAGRLPRLDREALTGRLPNVNGEALRRDRRPGGLDLAQVRYAAQLLPVGLALLRNPLVRQLVMRAAVRAARRG
jgi:hypothetical protein